MTVFYIKAMNILRKFSVVLSFNKVLNSGKFYYKYIRNKEVNGSQIRGTG